MIDEFSRGIGGTGMAALAGASPFARPIDLYRRLTGESTGKPQTQAMRLGQLLEEAIDQAYRERTGYKTRRRGVIEHPDYPFLRFHVDRLVVGLPGVLEIKASGWNRRGWGEEGTDQVPPDVRVQVVAYCGVLDREWADVARLASTREMLIYHVPADPELYDALVIEAVRFWQDHVVPRVPPPVDGSDSYREYLDTRFPVIDEIEAVATPEQTLLLDDLGAAMRTAKAAQADVDLLKNRLRESLGEVTLLRAPGATVTWRAREYPAWKPIADDYRAALAKTGMTAAELNFIEAMHTPPPSRVLITRFKDVEEAA